VQSNAYVLGFHISPPELLEQTTKEIQSLRSIYSSCPVFGVEFEIDSDVVSFSILHSTQNSKKTLFFLAARRLDCNTITYGENNEEWLQIVWCCMLTCFYSVALLSMLAWICIVLYKLHKLLCDIDNI